MKPFRAKTLIQVHYHDRFGGVNKVIAAYARAFASARVKEANANFVLCNRGRFPEASFKPAAVVAVAECEYREFASKADFLKVKSILAETLGRLLDNPVIKRPICVIGHNLTLGKNCALSAAFAQCALHCAASGAVRFYSVIHDFAEEGRVDCMSRIARVKKMGIAIEDDLYPTLKNVRYCTPSRGNALLLKKAGFDACWLPNPMETPKTVTFSVRKKTTEKNRCALLAKKCGTHFDGNLPIIFCPCRCIARKNILEAILLTTFVCWANLFLCAPGSSAGDNELFKKAATLCKKYRLPVVFNSGSVFAYGKTTHDFFSGLYTIADSCLSTSIAEGFGYALYEPWLYGKAIFGRKPMGFKTAAGVVSGDLYKTLPIPAAWVSLPGLAAKYRASMRACYGHLKETARFFDTDGFNRKFMAYFVKNGVIDFGCLDVATQLEVLSDLLKSPAKVEEWQSLCGKQLSAVQEAFEKSMRPNGPLIRLNKQRVVENLSMEAFSKRFTHLLNAAHPAAKPGSNYRLIAREFCSFSKFRLLMTPEEKGASA